MCQIEVNITKGFDEDERRLPKGERKNLTSVLNGFISSAKNGLFPRKLFRVSGLEFPKGFNKRDSSLYMFKATPDLRVILAYDNDILFNQKIITLYRVVRHNDAKNAFISTASLIYHHDASKES